MLIYGKQILADYGADVIKIEQRLTGDDTRHWRHKGESAKWTTPSPISFYFTAVNRNKRSLTLDLRKPAAREILYDLAKTSDVFMQNFIPGKAEELGLGYEDLARVNPRIIYASISGYGAEGPYARRAGYDAIAAAEGGLMHITGEAGGTPIRPGLGMVDMATGLYTHGAIIAALRARDITGKGQNVDASLFETMLSLLTNVGSTWLNMGIEGQRYGAAHPSIVPYNTFKTKDGYFALGANNEKQWKILCERIGRMDLYEDPRFKTNPLRVENREVVDSVMNKITSTKTNAEWLELLDGSGLACGPVNSIQNAFKHPQAQARGMVQAKDTDTLGGQPLNMIGPAVKFSETKAAVRERAPLLGEHTIEVLQEIGRSERDIQQLQSEEVI